MNGSKNNHNTYLGDGLYAEHDGWQIRLFSYGLHGLHEVFLEPAVFAALLAWQEKTMKNFKEGR